MAKYNEIMEHIDITDEMQSRVLRKVEKYFVKKKRAKNRVWFSVVGTVAAAVVILLAVSPLNNNPVITNPDGQNPSEVAGVYNGQEYGSVDELAAAVGFDVKDIDLPFEVTDTTYTSVDKYAEINYYGGSERLTFVKSVGTEDNSGDYNDYSVVKDARVGEFEIQLKGEQDGFCLAIWTDGEYSYSISSGTRLKEEVILQMVSEIIAK